MESLQLDAYRLISAFEPGGEQQSSSTRLGTEDGLLHVYDDVHIHLGALNHSRPLSRSIISRSATEIYSQRQGNRI